MSTFLHSKERCFSCLPVLFMFCFVRKTNRSNCVLKQKCLKKKEEEDCNQSETWREANSILSLMPVIVDRLIPCVDSKYMNNFLMWSCFLIAFLRPVLPTAQLWFSLPTILIVSTSKFRKESCLGGHSLSAGAQREDRVFALIVNACVQAELGRRDRGA